MRPITSFRAGRSAAVSVAVPVPATTTAGTSTTVPSIAAPSTTVAPTVERAPRVLPVRRRHARPAVEPGRPGRSGGPPAELRPAARAGQYRTVLRYGVTPFLVLLDLLAWGLGCTFFGWTLPNVAVFPLLCSLYAAAGLYRSRLGLSALDDSSRLVGRALAAGAMSVAGDVLVASPASPARPLATAAVTAAFVVGLRGLGYAVVRGVRARGLVSHPTLILGAGRVGAQIAGLLRDHPEYGLRPVGFLDRDPLLDEGERVVPLLGSDEVLAETIIEFAVRDVVVAFGSLPESGLVEVIRTCDRLDCEIFFVPRLFELHTTTRDMDHVWGLPLVRLRRAAFRSFSWKLKRAFDVVSSAAALLVLSPVLAAVAAAVRFEGGPGILFRQTRVGMDGRPFEVLKFRSLKPVDDSESATLWNVKHDDRLGPVGRFIRTTSLDELPQLWNILVGEMSVVGPRPERPYFVDSFASTLPRYVARHRVPSGLTGWAQVHGLRGDTSISERARFDNYYIENWSLWLDVRIIVMTVLSVLRRAGG